MTRHSETFFGVLIMLVGVGLWVLCANVRDFTHSSIDAAFLPRIAATMLLLLGLSIVYSGRHLAPRVKESSKTSRSGLYFMLASMVLMVAYVAFLDTLGFVICSVAYIFCQILLLRKQATARWLTFLIVALCVPVVAYLLFVYAFEVMVPAGILG